MFCSSVFGGEKVRFSISVEGTEHETLDERDVRQQTRRVINFYYFTIAFSALAGRKLIMEGSWEMLEAPMYLVAIHQENKESVLDPAISL